MTNELSLSVKEYFNKRLYINIYTFFLFKSNKDTPEERYKEKIENIFTYRSGLFQFLTSHLPRDQWKK